MTPVPEGDTLWRAAASLRPRLLNREVVRAEPSKLHRVRGTTVVSVESLGKNLLIRFDSGHTLRTHLRMRGRWRFFEPGRTWSASRPPAALLETSAGTAVCFDAPTVELTKTGAELVGHLGPDLLAATVDFDVIVVRARNRPSETPVGVLLLDQTVAAGIGNIHRCELLWAARLDPWRPQCELSDPELRRLYERAAEGLRRGTQPRFHSHAVHGRTGRPCPRCGTLVAARAQSVGELPRTTYWCPGCQRLPGADS